MFVCDHSVIIVSTLHTWGQPNSHVASALCLRYSLDRKIWWFTCRGQLLTVQLLRTGVLPKWWCAEDCRHTLAIFDPFLASNMQPLQPLKMTSRLIMFIIHITLPIEYDMNTILYWCCLSLIHPHSLFLFLFQFLFLLYSPSFKCFSRTLISSCMTQKFGTKGVKSPRLMPAGLGRRQCNRSTRKYWIMCLASN